MHYACATGTSHLSKRLRVRSVLISLVASSVASPVASLWPGDIARWTHTCGCINVAHPFAFHYNTYIYVYWLFKCSWYFCCCFCCYNSHSNGKLHINQLNHCIWHSLHVCDAAKVSKIIWNSKIKMKCIKSTVIYDKCISTHEVRKYLAKRVPFDWQTLRCVGMCVCVWQSINSRKFINDNFMLKCHFIHIPKFFNIHTYVYMYNFAHS